MNVEIKHFPTENFMNDVQMSIKQKNHVIRRKVRNLLENQNKLIAYLIKKSNEEFYLKKFFAFSELILSARISVDVA